jgi:hypothetical protein
MTSEEGADVELRLAASAGTNGSAYELAVAEVRKCMVCARIGGGGWMGIEEALMTESEID